jgi:hypothetical protein
MRILSNLIVSGVLDIDTINNAAEDTDKFLVADANGVIKYRTGAEVLSDIGAASAAGFVPYTGATANVDLGVYTILAQNATIASSGSGNTATITHSSGSGIALNITKGGNGEGLYINKTSGTGNAATIIGTLNATTLVKSGGLSTEYLKADGSVSTLTNPITGTGTSGQVAYFTGATTQAGSNNFFWDATNSRLGIGTITPILPLSVFGSAIIGQSNAFHTLTVGKAASGNFGANIIIHGYNSSFRNFEIGVGSQASNFSITPSSADGGNTYTTPALSISKISNVSIGSTTDSGQRLQVTGDTLLKGSGNTSATTALTVQNSDGYNFFTVRNDNVINIGLRPGVSIYPAAFGAVQNITGRGIAMSFIASSDAYEPLTLTHGNFTTTANGYIVLNTIGTFNPTSGAATYTANRIGSTINQVGSTGITRGLYVNPTLTAAADWRSIEWSNNSGWGLYGAGTANNYLAGRLAIGSTNFGSSVLAIRANLTGTTSQLGVLQSGTVLSDVTNTVRGFLNQLNTQAAAFSLFEYYHFDATQGIIGASSSVSNQYGFRASSSLTGATTNYGFYGDLPAATGRWNFYANGTALNYLNGSLLIGSTTDNGLKLQVTGTGYFSGSVGIGTTALTGVNLYINKNITGATGSQSVLQSGVVQSDVTSIAWGFYNQARTQATAFTLGTYYHYFAQQAALGAGSSITNQYGFAVDSTLTGATNNFGFYGNIASGTNRWNLYMNGTADNYLGGRLSIGTTNQSQGLRIGRNPTTADSRSIIVNLAIQNTVTSKYVAFSSSIGLGASGFTLPDLVHFEAVNDGTHTASVVTNLYGFRENLGTYSATNVYGHYGNIPSGTNRWNLYMNGSANNFLNGQLQIGTGSDTGEKLQVNGTAKITSDFSVDGGTLFVDATTNRVGINNAAPTYVLDVLSIGAVNTTRFKNTVATSALVSLFHHSDNTGLGVTVYGPSYAAGSAFSVGANGVVLVSTSPADFVVGTTTANPLKFGTNNTVKATLDSFGNLGLSVIPSAWSSLTAFQVSRGSVSATTAELDISHNAFYDGAWKYIGNGFATNHYTANGGYFWRTAASGTAGNAITFTQPMTLTAAGRLILGAGDSGELLQVNGTAKITGATSVRGNFEVYNYAAGLSAGDLSVDVTNRYVYIGRLSSNGGDNTTLIVRDRANVARATIPTGGSADTVFRTNNSSFIIQNYTGTDNQFLLNTTGHVLLSQKLGIGTSSIDASARLQVNSTTQGFLPPRMTATQRSAISSPSVGLVVYQTDGVEGLYIYTNANGWKSLAIVN